jgi:hypothetical protein
MQEPLDRSETLALDFVERLDTGAFDHRLHEVLESLSLSEFVADGDHVARKCAQVRARSVPAVPES